MGYKREIKNILIQKYGNINKLDLQRLMLKWSYLNIF